MQVRLILIWIGFYCLAGIGWLQADSAPVNLQSPDGTIRLVIQMNEVVSLSVSVDGTECLRPSPVIMELASGEVLVVDPPKRFEQSFEAADLDDPPSRITVEIAPAGGGSRVTLVHDRFARKTTTYRRFRRAHGRPGFRRRTHRPRRPGRG